MRERVVHSGVSVERWVALALSTELLLQPASSRVRASLIGEHSASDGIEPAPRLRFLRHGIEFPPRGEIYRGDSLLRVFCAVGPAPRVGIQRSVMPCEGHL